MGITFLGGPYDGRDLEQRILNRHAQYVPIEGDLGKRIFLLMPNPGDLERLLRGEKVEKGEVYPYEQTTGAREADYRWAPGAMDRATRESRLKIHPDVRTSLTVISAGDRRRIVESLLELAETPKENWPTDRVRRLREDSESYILEVSKDWRAFFDLIDGWRIELLDIVRTEALRFFTQHRIPEGVPQ